MHSPTMLRSPALRSLVLSSTAATLSVPADVSAQPSPSTDPIAMSMKKITPLITVDAVEPCLAFWTALGFEVTAQVPHEGKVGFAMLGLDDLEIMYQSRASVRADLGESGAPEGMADEMAGSTVTLFIEVESIDEVMDSLEEHEVLVPRRQTFYGMDEIFVRAPCGTMVGFAARAEGGEVD